VHELHYESPTSIAEAIRLLAEEPQAHILSGGTDLLIQLRNGRLPATRLVIDAKRIDELTEIQWDEDESLRIGAAVSCRQLITAPEVVRRYPGLAEAAALIGSRQIQSRASLGGNLCNGSPAADTIPALIALGARAVVAGTGGRRELPVEEFVTAPGRNALGEGEILAQLFVPAVAAGAADAYQRFTPRNEMDIAVVGVAASVTLDKGQCIEARVALGAVGPTPLVAEEAAAELVGGPIDETRLEKAARAAREAARPISDKRGSATYRRQLVHTLSRRTITAAARRAGA
jgi:CO/xanthine dehydrogenase FAD-binding subunit